MRTPLERSTIYASFLLATLTGLAVAEVARRVAPPAEKADKPVEVTMVKLSFRPDPVTITVGQAIRWTNNDDRDYSILAKDQSFKSGNLRPKETFEFKFKEAGTFEYMDMLHPRVTGTVVVNEKK